MKRRELIVEDEKRKLKIRYDSQSRRLHLIPVGSALRIQDHRTRRWDRRGTVIEVGKNRDYQIKFQSGRILWRNRKFIHIDYPEPNNQPVCDTESQTGRTTVAQLNRRVQFEENKPRRSIRKRRTPDFFIPWFFLSNFSLLNSTFFNQEIKSLILFVGIWHRVAISWLWCVILMPTMYM